MNWSENYPVLLTCVLRTCGSDDLMNGDAWFDHLHTGARHWCWDHWSNTCNWSSDWTTTDVHPSKWGAVSAFIVILFYYYLYMKASTRFSQSYQQRVNLIFQTLATHRNACLHITWSKQQKYQKTNIPIVLWSSQHLPYPLKKTKTTSSEALCKYHKHTKWKTF